MSVGKTIRQFFRGNRPPVYVDEGYIQVEWNEHGKSLKLVLRQDMTDLLNRMIALAINREETNLDLVDITKTPRLWLAYSDNIILGRLESPRMYAMLMQSILRCKEYGVVIDNESVLALRNSIKCFCDFVRWYGHPDGIDQIIERSELCSLMKERISARIWDVWSSE